MFTVDLSHNELTNTVSFSNVRKYQPTYYLSSNRLTFTGLETLVQKSNNHPVFYTPQAPVNIHQYNGKLAVNAGGTLNNTTYKWFMVGSTDSTVISSDSTFQPAQSGMYYALITNSIATALTLTTDTVSYTATLTKIKTVSIYPNPVNGILAVNGIDNSKTVKLTIADISGNIRMMMIASQQSSIKWNVSQLKQGSYILSISDSKGSNQTITFIKN